MRSDRKLKAGIISYLCLVLLFSSLTACENRSADTAVPSISTITPIPELSLAQLAARVCKGQAVPEAAAYINSPGAEHKIIVIGADDLPYSWNEELPQNLKAGTVEELEAVLCIESVDSVESTICGTYYDDTSNTRIEVKLGFYAMDLRLVAAKTGKGIASDMIYSDLALCPESIQSNDYHLVGSVYYGEAISWDTVWNNYYQNIHLAVANATSVPPTPTPTALPAGLPGPSVADWSVVVEDDFSDPNTIDWELSSGQTIADGVLTWNIQPTYPFFYSQVNNGTYFEYDFYSRLVVRHTGGNNADAYGLAFRMNNDEEAAFLIQDDGTFRIQNTRYIGTSPSTILPGKWNTLEVIGYQGNIYLYINGRQVFQYQEDDPYAFGQIGLAVMVVESPDTTAASTFEFDEFEVRYP